MNTTDMTTDSTAAVRGSGSTGGCRMFTATVNGTAQLVRALAVWPIDDVLEYEEQVDGHGPLGTAAELPLEAALMHDLTAARLIAPPRLRRRRDRGLSSRAVLFQAAR